MNAFRPRLARSRTRVVRVLLFPALVATPAVLAAATPGDQLRARLAAAAPGATIDVAAGEYDGPFVIDRSLHLVGAPGAVLRGDRRTHVVAIRAPDVEVHGFIIRDSGLSLADDHAAIHIAAPGAVIRDNVIEDSLHGIYVRKADNCRIENNVIRGQPPSSGVAAGVADPVRTGGLRLGDGGDLCAAELPSDRRGNGIHLWNSSGHVIRGNTISGTRDGIYFSFTDRTTVEGNLIREVRYGLHYMYSDENTFSGNVFTANAAGSALMYSRGIVLRGNRFLANRGQRAYGLLLQSVDDTRIEANEISGNTIGMFAENTNNCTITGNRLAGNHVGLRLSDSSAGNRFTANSFVRNLHPVETSGRNAANTWSIAGRGNYWDAAATLDLGRDGVADLPHHEVDLFGAWRRSFPAIGLLSGSPGERLLRFIHGRVALPGLAGITDPHPLTAPPPFQP